jgi:hypothetical protein
VPADPVEEAADRLYGLPLEDFVAERTATAKALRKDGDKEAAAAVAKLPKPSQVAWVANQLGRAGAGELLAAGDAVREAQLGGGGRDALREATAAHRAAVEELLGEARGLRDLSRDLTDRLRALLNAIAGDEEVREAFSAGRLVEEPSSGGAWPVGAFVAPPSPSASKEGGTKAGGGRKAPAKREAPAARRKREEKERRAAERARKEAERKREEAERRKLERRLATAREEADAAKQRLDMAQDAYERATHEVARIEEQLN